MTYFYITVGIAIAVLSIIHYILKNVIPAKTRGEYLIDIMKSKDEELYELMNSISQDLSCTLEAVVFTHYALIKDTEEVNGSELACENFVILLNDIYSNSKKGQLSLQLKSASELNKISKKLEEKKILKLPKNFSFDDLEEIFIK